VLAKASRPIENSVDIVEVVASDLRSWISEAVKRSHRSAGPKSACWMKLPWVGHLVEDAQASTVI